MTGASDLVEHVKGLLAAGAWEPAALHVRHGAQQVSSRAMAAQWRDCCAGVPAELRALGSWPEALAWAGCRSGDLALVREAVRCDFPGRLVFLAFLELQAERWSAVLTLLSGTQQWPGVLGVFAARFRAVALSELQDTGAEAEFARALSLASGRDLGLVWLELAYYRSRARQDAEARDAYAQALVWLRGDVPLLTLAHANLGIACLRLNDLAAAEFALRDALYWAGRTGGEQHLSTVWRVAGGAGMQRNLPARALAAFGHARDTATNATERQMALRGMGRALMAAGRFDRALSVLYEGLAEVPAGEPSALWLDVAVLHLQTGNVAGAREVLGRAVTKSDSDGWRLTVIAAELMRRAGLALPPDFLKPWPVDGNWVREESRLFPELFAPAGVKFEWHKPRGVVITDGPIRLLLDGAELPLPPHRHAAALLAFLVANGAASTAERVIEALALPGKDRRAKLKELSRVARDLAAVLGWAEAVQLSGGLVRLTMDIDWKSVVYPPAERSDLFCEGRLDPWIIEWRQDNLSLLT